MRIGLLQLVKRTMDNELTKLLDVRFGLQMPGERDSIVCGFEAKEQVADGYCSDFGRTIYCGDPPGDKR